MESTHESYDVILIGGGIIGLSLAWELAQHGVRVCVIDRSELGRGASWAASGMIPPGPSADLRLQCPVMEQLACLSQKLHLLWHERLLDQTGIDAEFRQTGALYLVPPADHTETDFLSERRGFWNRWHIEHRMLDSPEINALEPSLAPQTRGVLLPHEAQLRPSRYLRALISACVRAGVDLRSHCRVREFCMENGRVSAVVTDGGTFHPGMVCLTSGCWTGETGKLFSVNLPIRPVRGQIVLLRGGPGTLRHIINVGPRYLTPRLDGRILVGSTQEEAGFADHCTAAGVRELLNFSTGLCPRLANFVIEKTWAGLRPGTHDDQPYLGRIPELENAWIAAGHFRSGIQLAPATAAVMRQLMLGQAPEVDVSALSMTRAAPPV